MQKILSALKSAGYVPALLFEALVRARTGLYTAGLLPHRRLPAPVISVGNITMGGAGKTPLVICIGQMLSKHGYSPAVLTRGYRRMHPGLSHILSPGQNVPSPERILGDEPALIRRHLPLAWMGVSKNRFRSGTILAARDRRIVFVLDDGFQHRKLQRDLDVVIIDSSQPLRTNRLFPRGTLREPLSALCRCDLAVINGSPDAAEAGSVEAEVRKWKREAKVFYCRQIIGSLLPFDLWKQTDSAGPGTPPAGISSAYLVAAVGNPERFRRDVQQRGIKVGAARFFPDHYRLTNADWQDCVADARNQQIQTIITTEKDAVKIVRPPDFPLLIAVQSTGISDSGEFELILKKCIEERR